jgi:redox-sensitive bicupin YhaK (pirin superfamily)
MRSGKGVTHTERSPENGPETLHGYQLWIALPLEMEESDPAFFHIPAADIPLWKENDLSIRLLAGSAWGKEAPTPTWSPLFLADVRTEFRGELDLKGILKGEIALIVVKGEAWVDEQLVVPGQMLISKTEDACQLHLGDDTWVLIFGGQPLPEERFMFWNFVSHSKERLEIAKDDWRNKRFPKVPGDATYIPLPGESA